MKKVLLGASALMAVVVAAAPASATITFQLSNVTLTTPNNSPAGTLTGMFTTDDARTTVLSYNIQASAFGAFTGYLYTPATSSVTASVLPSQFFQLDSPGAANELRLYFNAPLTTSGASINPVFSYEFETAGGSRSVSGSVVAQATAVPEPAAWAMMILGLGAIGAATRYRRRRLTIAFA